MSDGKSLSPAETEDGNVIRFELLGTFSCGNTEEARVRNSEVIGRAGRKVLSFLQYLIVNHARHISADELIRQFWARSGSSNPANSLKNMIFKARSLLKEICPDHGNLFETRQGGYAWNPKADLRLDAEEFAALCQGARTRPGEGHMDTLLEAMALYRGDFLSDNDDDWTVPLRRYYQILYLDACKLVLPFLQEKGRLPELIGICEQAAAVDSGEDIFAIYQMQALISMGHPERALELYEDFRRTLWEEFEVEPSGEVEKAYLLAKGMCQGRMRDRDVLRVLAESGEADGCAFLCTFSVFRSIVALERRHLARSRRASSIVLVRLDSGAVPTTDARRLERILLEGLRTADPVARLDAASYILLLTGASVENAQAAVGRVDRMFHKTYTHSKASITYRIFALRPQDVSAEWEGMEEGLEKESPAQIAVGDPEEITGR